jgi:hypothetical protein
MSIPLRYRLQHWVNDWVDLFVDLLRILSFGYIDKSRWAFALRRMWYKLNTGEDGG